MSVALRAASLPPPPPPPPPAPMYVLSLSLSLFRWCNVAGWRGTIALWSFDVVVTEKQRRSAYRAPASPSRSGWLRAREGEEEGGKDKEIVRRSVESGGIAVRRVPSSGAPSSPNRSGWASGCATDPPRDRSSRRPCLIEGMRAGYSAAREGPLREGPSVCRDL